MWAIRHYVETFKTVYCTLYTLIIFTSYDCNYSLFVFLLVDKFKVITKFFLSMQLYSNTSSISFSEHPGIPHFTGHENFALLKSPLAFVRLPHLFFSAISLQLNFVPSDNCIKPLPS